MWHNEPVAGWPPHAGPNESVDTRDDTTGERPPILRCKNHRAPSLFTPDALLREASMPEELAPITRLIEKILALLNTDFTSRSRAAGPSVSNSGVRSSISGPERRGTLSR